MREENAVDKYVRVNPEGLFEPNWMWRDVLPFALGPDPAINNGVITLPVGSTTPKVIPYKVPHSSMGQDDDIGNPLLIDQIVFNEPTNTTAGADFTVFMVDNGDQRQFMNFPVHVRTFAGSSQLSARLAEDLFLPTRHQLNLAFASTGQYSNNTLNLFLWGKFFDPWSSNLQKYPQDRADMLTLINKWLERRKYVSPYWMTTDMGAVTIPANQTIQVDAIVGSEGHFEATHILRAAPGTSTQSSNPFEVSILNPQTRQALMNGAIHSYMIGDAFNPQPFPAPFIVPAGQIIRFQIKDLSGSSNTVYLTLRGRKWRCPIKDITQVKQEYGIGITDGLPSPTKSMAREMEGASA